MMYYSVYCRFSFCQYPFILSITAKRTILQRDSEQQMIIMARVNTNNVIMNRRGLMIKWVDNV